MSVVSIDSLAGAAHERERACCAVLERGDVLLFPETPFALSLEDRALLLKQRLTEAGYHKNIAYRPGADRVTGVARQQSEDAEKLRRVLSAYSRAVVEFASRLLPRYASRWRLDFASFRPQEEAGRKLSVHSRNDLLHVDSFPTRPTSGDRIFRVFTNVNPQAPRLWRTGEGFEELAERFADSSGLLAKATRSSLARTVASAARRAGLPVRVRPPYDEFMLRFHHFLKENGSYQENARAEQISFPPGSTWMVFTDMVTHSVLSGQFALEQTFLIARESLFFPERAPIAVLERLAGRALA
ncbi:MAG TPA: Kdo hydroxylase family protein [Thermoanaerobaculia bacterium]